MEQEQQTKALEIVAKPFSAKPSSALSHSKMAQYKLKKSVVNDVLSRQEHKNYKKLERSLSNMLFSLTV